MMMYGPQFVDGEKKGVVGFISAFFLTFGIMTGTFLALIFAKVGT